MNTTTINQLAATDNLIKQNQVVACWARLNSKLAPIIGDSLDFPVSINAETVNTYRQLNNEIEIALNFLGNQEVNEIKKLNNELISALLDVNRMIEGDK
ncbi:hypothetical protein ACOCGI_003674 [Vibrio cholerae]